MMCSGVDVDERKTAMLQRGEVPIHEPGLDTLIKRGADAGAPALYDQRAKEGVDHGLFQLIAVGHPARRGRFGGSPAMC